MYTSSQYMMYEWAHLQEILDIDAIQKSHSPWASAVVLVLKKDSNLRFCSDLKN